MDADITPRPTTVKIADARTTREPSSWSLNPSHLQTHNILQS